MSCIIDINGEQVAEKSWFPKPSDFNDISEQSLKINKTTIEELQSRQLTQKRFLGELVLFLTKYISVKDKFDFYSIAGHNVLFDINFLKALFSKYNMEQDYNRIFDFHVIDTSFLAITPHYLNKNWKASNYGLGATCESYGIEVDKEKAHGAMYDVKLCRDLYRKAVVGK